MSYLFKFLFIIALTPLFGQNDDGIYSVYFDSKADPGTDKLNGIPVKYHGTFNLINASDNDLRMAAGDNLVVDETGVFLLKNRLLSISREEIRENSQYTISGDYLHGVLEKDSVLVSLENESYYFLIPRKVYLYELGNVSTRIYKGLIPNETLILSREDNAHYSAIYLSFQAGEVILKELNFDQKTLDFRSLKGKKTEINGTPTYILNPSKTEWKQLMNYFIEYDRYRAVAKK